MGSDVAAPCNQVSRFHIRPPIHRQLSQIRQRKKATFLTNRPLFDLQEPVGCPTPSRDSVIAADGAANPRSASSTSSASSLLHPQHRPLLRVGHQSTLRHWRKSVQSLTRLLASWSSCAVPPVVPLPWPCDWRTSLFPSNVLCARPVRIVGSMCIASTARASGWSPPSTRALPC